MAERGPIISDVAELARVSSATVSYVLSGRHDGAARYSEETRRRVLEAASQLGYTPNQAARTLRRRRVERVCLVTTTLSTPYSEILAEQFDAAADAHGYTSLILLAGTPARNSRVVEQLRRGLADGAYVGGGMAAEQVAALLRQGLAIVRESSGAVDPAVDTLVLPHRAAVRTAVDHLLERGHRRVGYVGFGPLDARSERFQSYSDALAARGLAVDPELCALHVYASRLDAYRQVAELLRRPRRPSALFADTDLAAIAAIWAVRDAGLRVPQDVAVIGIGNLPDGLTTLPPLTTVGPARVDFSPALDMLFSRLAGDAPAEGRVVIQPWALIERGSV